ncbi:MAG: sugar transferase [Planctomycetota bacterium]
MIQTVEARSRTVPIPGTAPRVWGLSATELHDAYWRARGVQCIRRGERQPLQRSAELFLLVPAGQLVLFDLAPIAEHLRWHDALVTRLRLIDHDDDGYSEHVVTDDDGNVLRVERRYGHRRLLGGHIILTSKRRLASMWMSSPNRREGWRRIRRSVPWARVDHGKVLGRGFARNDASDEHQLLEDLVARWSNPDQVIDGLRELEPDVWVSRDDSPNQPRVLVGPIWAGRGSLPTDRACLVGPLLLPDRQDAEQESTIAVRDISAVEYMSPNPDVMPAPPRRAAGYEFAKRAFDLCASLAMLALIWPVLAIIALLIMLEDGRPVTFAHRRRGRHNRSFPCLKFRTMHQDAERMARELDAYNVCDGPQVFIQDDPRVTRIGRFLRRTSLDELPQLFNVVRGQMSLVGPRPSPEDENQFCPAWRDLRLSVRPGITGLWQLMRTREPGEDFQEWIRYDIEYVQRATFWLDIKILVRTARMLLLGKG